MTDPMPMELPLPSPWTGEFRDPAAEEAYYRHTWPRLGTQSRIVMAIAGVMYLGATYLDYDVMTAWRPFCIMLGLRILVALVLAGCILAAARPSLFYRWLLMAVMILIGITELSELYIFARQPSGAGGLPFILVIILMAYVMVPNRVWMTVLGSSCVSLMFLGYQGHVSGWEAPASFQMGLYLLMANATGYAFQVHWNRLMRQDFSLRIKLQHEVRERQRAEEAAQRANETKSRFLAVVSHEIRTPLNGVLGGVQLLQETTLHPEQLDYLELIGHSGDHLARLLDDVLDLARIEAGHTELRCEAFSPAALLTSVQAVLRPQALARHLELHVEAPAELPQALLGDAMRLRQVLINLLGNGVKFTETGTVSLALEVQPPTEGSGKAQCTFRVQDTGPGMDEATQTRVFEAFEQGDNSTRRNHGGTGLGLAISRELVTAMGGELHLESAPGQGSRFHFTLLLPLAAQGKPQQPLPQASVPLRVLVVDDLPANRMVATGLLRSLGHQAIEAASGAEALATLRTSPFDAVLLDLHMPDMDGMEVYRRFRAEAGKGLAFFLVTADTEQRKTQACLEEGLQGLIPKPIRKEVLAARLAGIQAKRPQEPEAEEPLVDRGRIEETREDLGPTFWSKALEACHQSMQASLAQLEDPSLVPEALHRLMGLSACYAMPRLHRELTRIKEAWTPGGTLPLTSLRALARDSLDQLGSGISDIPGSWLHE